MRVIVTRPESDAAVWVAALQAGGHEAVSLPLIDIEPPADASTVQRTWQRWTEWQAVMFVSAQAVRLFFHQRPPDVPLLPAPRCWATGPGTCEALMQAGVPADRIDSPSADAPQFDSEALWQRVGPSVKASAPVLIVRGADATHDATPEGNGRDWLARQLQALDVPVVWLVAYARRAPRWTDAQCAQARAALCDGSVWFISSSQALSHLRGCLPEQSWQQARCIATHPRIAETARALGFGDVRIARPVLPDVLRSLESWA